MKTPFCKFDLKTGVPCPKCQSLIDNGVYTKLDFEISRILYELEDNFSFLKDAEYFKSIKEEDTLFIVIKVKRETPYFLIKRLERKVSKKLKTNLYVKIVLWRGEDIKSLIENLIRPARLTTITTVWFPDGSLQYNVRLTRREIRRLPFPRNMLEKVLSKILGHGVEIVFS